MRSATITVPTLMAAACRRDTTTFEESAVEATMPAAAGVGSPTK
jgi:hypothetical protein